MSQTNNTYFSEFYFNFENTCLPKNICQCPFDNAHFGIIKMNAYPCKITSLEQDFVFVIDRSGSMSDRCEDGRTKMHHIIHTLKNMIIYFQENPSINLNITIFVFDNNFDCIIQRTKISENNITKIIETIDKIRPLGSTNIESALNNINNYIDELQTNFPDNHINHIFMTDGEATEGSGDCEFLKNCVNNTVENIFIGFGINHDAFLLNHLSSHKNSSYYFIDILEKSGLVYGEILHSILYKYLDDVIINITDGLIYDFKNNKWVNKLCVGNIVGEANKIYHIISNTYDLCNITVNCNVTSVNGIEKENILLHVPELIHMNSNYTNYLYRQRTLELLFEVNETENKKNNNIKTFYSHQASFFTKKLDDTKNKDNIDFGEQESILKQRLRNLIEEIKQYMAKNNLNNDKFLKNLCDDIYISYKTIGTKYGGMYSCARQNSQGSQRCYTVTHTPDDMDDYDNDICTQNLSISKKFSNNGNNNIHSLTKPPDLEHHVSNFTDTPYLIPTASKLMRDVSSNNNNNNNNNQKIHLINPKYISNNFDLTDYHDNDDDYDIFNLSDDCGENYDCDNLFTELMDK